MHKLMLYEMPTLIMRSATLNFSLAINELFQKGNTRSVEGKADLEGGSLTFEASQALFAEAKVEFEKTWDFGKMKNQIKASAEIGVRETSKFSASAKINKGALDGIGHSRDLLVRIKIKVLNRTFQLIN